MGYGDGGPKVVALGGGHGLYASLSALRAVTDELTAVVTVADDGGSSGRLRREFGVLPPGDLRMALAALCGDDEWGRTWSAVVQHRFGVPGEDDAYPEESLSSGPLPPGSLPPGPLLSGPLVPGLKLPGLKLPGLKLPGLKAPGGRTGDGGTGEDELHGHAVGNLLIVALWELLGDTVAGLDWVGRLLGAHGRVLPMASVPLDIVAEVELDGVVSTVTGQVACASTPGRVRAISLIPENPPACPEAVRAVLDADWVVFGPGSWFTSVLPHLKVPELAEALHVTRARRLVTLNLAQQPGETDGFSPQQHLEVLSEHAPDLKIDVVLADTGVVDDPEALRKAAAAMGARLVMADVAAGDGSARHDPRRLASVLDEIFLQKR